jgi:hypothetical protein
VIGSTDSERETPQLVDIPVETGPKAVQESELVSWSVCLRSELRSCTCWVRR